MYIDRHGRPSDMVDCGSMRFQAIPRQFERHTLGMSRGPHSACSSRLTVLDAVGNLCSSEMFLDPIRAQGITLANLVQILTDLVYLRVIATHSMIALVG